MQMMSLFRSEKRDQIEEEGVFKKAMLEFTIMPWGDGLGLAIEGNQGAHGPATSGPEVHVPSVHLLVSGGKADLTVSQMQYAFEDQMSDAGELNTDYSML